MVIERRHPRSGVWLRANLNELENALPMCANVVKVATGMAKSGKQRLYRNFYWRATHIVSRAKESINQSDENA